MTIHPSHRPWLGIQFVGKFYQFVALPFGLNISPWLFTKVMRCPINYWRRKHGFKIGCFIDDGYATATTAVLASDMANQIRNDLDRLGFLYYDSPKSFWTPDRSALILGMQVDLDRFCFSIAADK
jgi:hypothetical protein